MRSMEPSQAAQRTSTIGGSCLNLGDANQDVLVSSVSSGFAAQIFSDNTLETHGVLAGSTCQALTSP